jgi:hypothetical protein
MNSIFKEREDTQEELQEVPGPTDSGSVDWSQTIVFDVCG